VEEQQVKIKEKFVLVVIPLTRWKAWLITVFNDEKAEKGYFDKKEIDRRKWTDKLLNDKEGMLKAFKLNPALYQLEVHFFSWSKLKTIFPALIPAEVLKKYRMKF